MAILSVHLILQELRVLFEPQWNQIYKYTNTMKMVWSLDTLGHPVCILLSEHNILSYRI